MFSAFQENEFPAWKVHPRWETWSVIIRCLLYHHLPVSVFVRAQSISRHPRYGVRERERRQSCKSLLLLLRAIHKGCNIIRMQDTHGQCLVKRDGISTVWRTYRIELSTDLCGIQWGHTISVIWFHTRELQVAAIQIKREICCWIVMLL